MRSVELRKRTTVPLPTPVLTGGMVPSFSAQALRRVENNSFSRGVSATFEAPLIHRARSGRSLPTDFSRAGLDTDHDRRSFIWTPVW